MRDMNAVIAADAEIRDIWGEAGELRRILDVEASIAEAHAAIGNIPIEHAAEIRRVAESGLVSWDRVREIDKRLHHTMMSVVRAMAEVCERGAGESIHLAVGTAEVTATARALQFRDTLDVIKARMVRLIESLRRIAIENEITVMPGRSLGQHILPYSFGHRVAVWTMEIARHCVRVDQAYPRVTVGMLRGAVGTRGEQVALDPRTLDIESIVLEHLGLPGLIATDQHIERDRTIEFAAVLANIAGSLEKIAWNIRTLQRTEVGELEEPFDDAAQVGSSAAPHKRNPRHAEIVAGLAKAAKGYSAMVIDNSMQEHESDSVVTVIDAIALPGLASAVGAALIRMQFIIDGLNIHTERMRANVDITKGRIVSSGVLMELSKVLGRQTAHEIVRTCAMQAAHEDRQLASVLAERPDVMAVLTPENLEDIFDPERYLGDARDQIAEMDRWVTAYLAGTDVSPSA